MTYLDHHPCVIGVVDGVNTRDVTHSWQAFTQARMEWLYGSPLPEHVVARQRADVAAWERLGRSAGAAA